MLFLSGCLDFLDPDECRFLNSINPGAATMHVGETRRFEAAGFQEGDRQGSCVGTIRPGFTWSSSRPLVASVDPTTGIVTAHTVGTATIRAHRESPERDGELQLRVVAAP